MKTLIRAGWTCVLLSLIVGVSVPALAAHRLLMKIEGPDVMGESKFQGYRNWIVVNSFSQEVSNLTGTAPDLKYISLMKLLDSASVELAYHAVAGTAFSKVILEVSTEYGSFYYLDYQVELLNPRVTHIQPELTKEGLQEGVVFGGFTQITWKYVPRDAQGRPGVTVIRTVPGN